MDRLPIDSSYIASHPLLGLFFKDVEVFEDGPIRRARFVMNDFWKAHRAGDDERGALWFRTGEID